MSMEKTFYSCFISGDGHESPINYGDDDNANPRDLEVEQILKLMNIIAEKVYVGHFDPALGTARIENQIQKGGDIPEPHLIAYRLSREEILYSCLRFVPQIVQNYFITTGNPIQDDKLCH